MPPPLVSEGQVTYADGTKSTVDQMAKDVSAFLVWTAEPNLERRHASGLAVVLFLLFATVLGYLPIGNIWAEAKRKVRVTGRARAEEPGQIARCQERRGHRRLTPRARHWRILLCSVKFLTDMEERTQLRFSGKDSPMRLSLVALTAGAALALGGCAFGGVSLGYGSPYYSSYGYGSGYGYDRYGYSPYGYDDFGYGYGYNSYGRYGGYDPYSRYSRYSPFGWYGGYYYPGTGYYVYDRDRRRRLWSDVERRHWSEARQRAVTAGATTGQQVVTREMWDGFNQRRQQVRTSTPQVDRRAVRVERPARVQQPRLSAEERQARAEQRRARSEERRTSRTERRDELID